MHGRLRCLMRIAHVNVFVSDFWRAVGFYRDVLGLDHQYAADEQQYASLATGPIRLGVGTAGDRADLLVARHSGVGFEVDDVEAEHQRLVAAGVRFPMPPQRQPWGAWMALFEHPDGNVHCLDQAATCIDDE